MAMNLFVTGSASPTPTIASTSASPGGANIKPRAMPARATASSSDWRSRALAANPRFTMSRASWGRAKFQRLESILTKFIRALPLIAIATAAIAQDAGETPNSAANLNIPANGQLLGKVDPHLRKATAIVNGAVITGTDVDQRLALIVLANGGKVPDAELDRLRLQVLRNLIDEKLQIQEAKTHDITIE